MPEFNLIDEPWVPCLMLEGDAAREFGLRETLQRAHEIREIFDNSPLVTVALHRLLLAILHRNFGPASFGAWKDLWKEKRWNADKINDYFNNEKIRRRFDLFDAERPFLQHLNVAKNDKGDSADLQPVALLAQELAAGNNATLFDHSFENSGKAIEAKTAAKYLLARQAYSVSLGVSYPFSLSDSTIVRGFVLLAFGKSLFETLALNLVIYNEETPLARNQTDLPIWEQNDLAKPNKEGTTAAGYLDYLTWQCRQIQLIPQNNSTDVLNCRLQQNLKLSAEPKVYDPFKCYVRSDVKEPFKPKGLSASKALWRDSHVLFEQFDDAKSNVKRPEIFNHLARIEKTRRSGEIEARPIYSFTAFGLGTDANKAASVIFWARERLPLPLAYLTEEGKPLVVALKNALKLAETEDFKIATFSQALRGAVRSLAKLLLAPDSDDPNARQPDGEDVKKLVKSFGAEEVFWSRLYQPFNKLIVDLPEDFAPEAKSPNAATKVWAQALNRIANDAFDQIENGLSGSARELKAFAQARGLFHYKMRILRNENKHLFNSNGSEYE